MSDGPLDTSSPLYVVGARTGRAAKARGWRLASPPARDADELITTLAGALKPGASVLYLAGRDRKEVIEAALTGAFALRSRRSLCGGGAQGLAPGRSACSRLLRRRPALFAPLGRARGGAGEGSRRGGLFPQA